MGHGGWDFYFSKFFLPIFYHLVVLERRLVLEAWGAAGQQPGEPGAWSLCGEVESANGNKSASGSPGED